MRRKKIMVWVLAAGMFLMAGCSKKADKIEIVDETQTGSGEVEKVQDDFAQFREEEKWVDEIQGTYHGENAGISVKADILATESTQSMVVEVKRPALNEEYRKSVLKGAFGDADIYYHDIAHWTTEELQRELEIYESDEENNSMDPEYKKALRKYLKDSKDEYTKADVFDVDEYIASRNGIWYELSFGQEEGNLKVSFAILDTRKLKPKGLWEHASGTMIGGSSLEEGIENRCSFSAEEAKKEVVSFAEKMGIYNLTFKETQGLCFQPAYDEKNAEWEKKEFSGEVMAGYEFLLGTGINDEVLFGSKEQSFLQMAWVTEEGVVDFAIINPVEVERVTEHVPLLPLDKIKEAFLLELSENLDAHSSTKYGVFQFTSLKLDYLLQIKDSSGSEGTYLPVWVLKGDGIQIYVNAIDGTVIPEEDIR
ncbi:MAG TPA: hypothetical protein DDY31_19825 [Lachnospiraceae bacterium]|nr:hypothetical protein [Lachnospiraceae bacterium]